jgi:hypothetical protein
LFTRQRISGRSGDNLFQRADVCGFGVYRRISSRCSNDRSPGHQTKRDRKKAPPKQASATPSAKAKACFASFQAAFEERSIIIGQRAKSDFVQTGPSALVCCL